MRYAVFRFGRLYARCLLVNIDGIVNTVLQIVTSQYLIHLIVKPSENKDPFCYYLKRCRF